MSFVETMRKALAGEIIVKTWWGLTASPATDFANGSGSGWTDIFQARFGHLLTED